MIRGALALYAGASYDWAGLSELAAPIEIATDESPSPISAFDKIVKVEPTIGPENRAVPDLRAIREEFRRNHILLRSAALTYTTLFAIVPLLVMAFVVLSSLPFSQGSAQNLEALVSHTFPWVTAKVVAAQLERLSHRATRLNYAGVLILLATMISLLRSIELSFNEIYQVRTSRSLLKRFLTYSLITVLSCVLLALSISFHSYLFAFDFVGNVADLIGVDVRYLGLLPVALSAVSFSAIYVLVPNAQVPIGFALIGGTLVAIAFELARKGFNMFLVDFARNDLFYGAFAFVPVFLMWIHFSWIVILTGLLLVKMMHEAWLKRGERTRP